jgi:hypothetical protein
LAGSLRSWPYMEGAEQAAQQRSCKVQQKQRKNQAENEKPNHA